MAMTLAEIRAKLQANENRGSGKQQGDNAIYAHWNIPENTTARVRFLPDADPKNNFFWVERAMINLPFAGIKGQADSKPVIVQVPCVEMYGAACPVLAEVRTWFKDPNLEEIYVLDDLDQPRLIENLKEFKDTAFAVNQTAMKKYYLSFIKLSEIRRKINL